MAEQRGRGRPKGSRCKTALMRAQYSLDQLSEEAVLFFKAVMNNDKTYLDLKEDIPLKERIAAAKEIMGKSISNEVKKEIGSDGVDANDEHAKENKVPTPIFSMVAKG